MPSKIKNYYKQFQENEKYVATSFWVVDLLFVTFCHKIKLVKKVFYNNWAMFFFKLSLIAGPLYFTMALEK